jgi:hypothetical protein
MKSPVWTFILVSMSLASSGASARPAEDPARRKGSGDPPKAEQPSLDMSKAVVCKKVEGFEKYVELPDASLTSEDKLNVYFRPLNYRVDPVDNPRPGRRFQARFVEDCRIRRKGEKVVLQKKDKLLEHDATFESPDYQIYLLNNISLKGLTPGDYELDVILHDVLESGATSTQSVAFTVVSTPKVDPAPKAEGTAEPEGKAVPVRESKKSKPSKTKTKP